ncbi:MAG: MerR family transcriptional regulator [Thermotogae bacterium]|nr:MerR family transcriptional regulator [Thermotogota bacterium]
MKIGDFSKKFDIPVDTVRYYIEQGLLLPEKKNNQYSFDEKDTEDMKEILKLKDLKFTLSEIHKIITIKRLKKVVPKIDIKYIKDMLREKLFELKIEQKRIEAAIKEISMLNDDFEEDNSYVKELGFPITLLGNIVCPVCGGQPVVNARNIKDNYIFEGNLKCSCGYEMNIHEGIIVLPEYTQEERDYNKYMEEIVSMHNISIMDEIGKSIEWISKRLNENVSVKQTVLEFGMNPYCILSRASSDQIADNIFIISDIDFSRIKLKKSYFEKRNEDMKIIFIAGNFEKLPLKKESIDVVIDYTGTINFQKGIAKNNFPVYFISELLKREGKWIGLYLFFEEYSKSFKEIPKEYTDFYIEEKIRKSFEDNKINIDKKMIIEYRKNSDKIISVHHEGDLLNLLSIKGEKSNGG